MELGWDPRYDVLPRTVIAPNPNPHLDSIP